MEKGTNKIDQVSISPTFYAQPVDPERVKKIDILTVFFTLLGSASVKAVRRTLMKLSPERWSRFGRKGSKWVEKAHCGEA